MPLSGGCNFPSTSRTPRMVHVSGLRNLRPQAPGNWAASVDRRRQPSSSAGSSIGSSVSSSATCKYWFIWHSTLIRLLCTLSLKIWAKSVSFSKFSSSGMSESTKWRRLARSRQNESCRLALLITWFCCVKHYIYWKKLYSKVKISFSAKLFL